jgi:hypothetical protein
VVRDARKLKTRSSQGEAIETHEIEVRMAGELWFAKPPFSDLRAEQVLAVFAASFTPKPGCTTDADGHGCDSIRLRGRIHGATRRTLPP